MSQIHSINLRSTRWAGRCVGLLGGSFNPAHRGHLMITRQALHHLALDEVWWMVSPQNPLKSEDGMARLAGRLESARKMACDPRIRVTDIETHLGTRFTADTLQLLSRRLPATKFVWLMGADNMVQITEWKRWTEVFNTCPVAVFGRPTYSLEAMASKAAKRFARNRVRAEHARSLADMKPPSWTFIHYRHDPISATQMRAAMER